MSKLGKLVLFYTLLVVLVGFIAVLYGRCRMEELERHEKALLTLVCLEKCSSYNNGCRDACGEDAACQERCRARHRTCINKCGH